MTEPDIANVVTIVALIVASLLISYLTAQHALKQAQRRCARAARTAPGGLTDAIAELERRVAELPARAPTASGAPEPAGRRMVPRRKLQCEVRNEEVPAEILILISAAVTSFLGKKVRIRSAKMLQSPYEIVNPWAQQGRVIVQASHRSRKFGIDEPKESALEASDRN